MSEIWKVGSNTGVVITTDTKNDKEKTGHTGPEAVMYYGGHLICESVRSHKDAKLIAAAPEMLLALTQVVGAIEGGTKDDEGSYTQRFGQAFIDYINEIINRTK